MKLALLIVGILGIVVGLAVTLISLVLHLSSPRHISFDEAFPAMAGGCCCSSVALVIALGGLVWLLLDREKKAD